MKTLPIMFGISLLASATDISTCMPGKDPGSQPTPPGPSDGLDPALAKNPLVAPSQLPFGAPDFAKIQAKHFMPAIQYAMKLQTQQIASIVNNPTEPTFDNTVAALDGSGQLLKRTLILLRTMARSLDDVALETLEQETAKLESAHVDAIYQNAKLFGRVQSIHAKSSALPESQARILKLHRDKFLKTGAGLSADKQQKLRELNQRIAAEQTSYGQNLSVMLEEDGLLLSERSALEGLSDAEIDTLAKAASDAGHEGKYLINLVNTSRHPLLSRLSNRETRSRLWKNSTQRGTVLNREVARNIAVLRFEKARLLGYDSWSQLTLEPQLAKSAKGVMDTLGPISAKVMDRAKAEAAKLEEQIEQADLDHELEGWDWLYYAEKVRQKEFDFDASLLRPYFELDKVREQGVFFAMEKLFGLSFVERKDIPGYHPDMRVYEVATQEGDSLGLIFVDDFVRPGKRGGSWISTLKSRVAGDVEHSIVSVSASYTRPTSGPMLLSYSQVESMFYMMGYAVASLMVDAQYHGHGLDNLPRDFSGFSPQFFAYCALEPSVLAHYAKHHESDKPLPKELVDRMQKARNFNKGYDVLEYLKASYLDLAWHSDLDDLNLTDIPAFEAKTFADRGVDMPQIAPRYGSTYFSHIFFAHYASSYYSYLATEIYAADAFDYVQAHGGLNRDNGGRLQRLILSKGNRQEAASQFLDFRGKAPDVQAYLRRIGMADED